MTGHVTAACSRCGPERQVLTFGPGFFGCVTCGRGYGKFIGDSPYARTLEAVREWNTIEAVSMHQSYEQQKGQLR